jgi:hypothetical protein
MKVGEEESVTTKELSESARLQRRITRLEEQLRESRQEAAQLRESLLGLEQEHQELLLRYSLAEDKCNEQMVYRVSLWRLYEADERAEVIRAVSEIVVDLIGADRFVLYELSTGTPVLCRLTSHGIDDEQLHEVPVHDDYLAESYFAGINGPPHQLLGGHELVALIPLRLGGTVIGALAIFGLLPHKSSLEELDLELLELLAIHAPIALHLAQRRRSPGPEGRGC